MNDVLAPRCLNRLFEWAMAFAMLGIGIHIMLVPGAFASSRMSPLLDLVISLPVLVFLYLAAATIRLVGLYFSVQLKSYGFHMRAAGSALGSLNWAQMALALIITARETGNHVSPMIWLYTSLAAAEIISTYRAQVDGHYAKL